MASSSKASSSSTKAKEEKKKGKKKEKSKEKKEKKLPPGACHHCGQEGHWNRDCPKKKKKPDQPSSSSLNVVKTEASASDAECNNILCYLSSSTEDWLMDSGATEHLTPWRSDLSDYVSFPESHQTHVVLGDSKTRLCILGKGKAIKWVQHPTTHKFTKVTLTDVQHIQGITRRFLSLSTFNDKGFELHMKLHQFKLSKGKAALYGHWHGKLYIAPMYRDRPTPPSLNSTETALSTNLWHKRMGHMNYEALKTAGKAGTSRSPVLGIKLDSTPLDTKSCTGCLAGKSKQQTYNASQNRPQHSQFPIERIHSDLIGPIQTTSINGHHFTVTFTCDKTTHTWCFPLKSKDQTLGHFKCFVTEVEAQTGLKIHFFRLDCGGEFMGKEFDTFLADKGIIRETSAPDTPQQNGLAERMNQTIWSGVRALLHHSGIKNGFWVEALAIAVHVVNRSPCKLLEWRTPYKALTGRVPDISHFHVFGCRAWVHNNKGKKLDAGSIPMIFIGYKSRSKAYCLWDPKSHRIIISSDVQFNEEEFPALPPPEPVAPVPSSSQDTLPFQQSEGASKKQVNFVDLPEIFTLFDEEV